MRKASTSREQVWCDILKQAYPGLSKGERRKFRKLLEEKAADPVAIIHRAMDPILFSVFRHSTQYEVLLNSQQIERQNARGLVQPILDSMMRKAKGGTK